MKIAKDTVVTIEYELKTAEGEILDSSEENGALSYLHGSSYLFPGLEKNLEGKTTGDSITGIYPPEEAYGLYDDKLVFKASRGDFEEGVELFEGMEFPAEVGEEMRVCTIIHIDGDEVTIDANHPLCDEELHVRAKVLDVRQASEEEIAHGHVHDGNEEH